MGIGKVYFRIPLTIYFLCRESVTQKLCIGIKIFDTSKGLPYYRWQIV